MDVIDLITPAKPRGRQLLASPARYSRSAILSACSPQVASPFKRARRGRIRLPAGKENRPPRNRTNDPPPSPPRKSAPEDLRRDKWLEEFQRRHVVRVKAWEKPEDFIVVFAVLLCPTPNLVGHVSAGCGGCCRDGYDASLENNATMHFLRAVDRTVPKNPLLPNRHTKSGVENIVTINARDLCSVTDEEVLDGEWHCLEWLRRNAEARAAVFNNAAQLLKKLGAKLHLIGGGGSTTKLELFFSRVDMKNVVSVSGADHYHISCAVHRRPFCWMSEELQAYALTTASQKMSDGLAAGLAKHGYKQETTVIQSLMMDPKVKYVNSEFGVTQEMLDEQKAWRFQNSSRGGIAARDAEVGIFQRDENGNLVHVTHESCSRGGIAARDAEVGVHQRDENGNLVQCSRGGIAARDSEVGIFLRDEDGNLVHVTHETCSRGGIAARDAEVGVHQRDENGNLVHASRGGIASRDSKVGMFLRDENGNLVHKTHETCSRGGITTGNLTKDAEVGIFQRDENSNLVHVTHESCSRGGNSNALAKKKSAYFKSESTMMIEVVHPKCGSKIWVGNRCKHMRCKGCKCGIVMSSNMPVIRTMSIEGFEADWKATHKL